MKYSSAFVIAALLGASYVEQTQAVKLSAGSTDDLMKSLAADMQKDAEAETTEAAPEKVEEKKPAKKAEQKKSE